MPATLLTTPWLRAHGFDLATSRHYRNRGLKFSTTVAFRGGALGLVSGIVVGLGVGGGDATGSVRGRDGDRVDTSRSGGRAAVGSPAHSVRSTRCRRRVLGPPF